MLETEKLCRFYPGAGGINIIPYSTRERYALLGEKTEPLPLSDGQTFDLGGRITYGTRCPGHTPGEMVLSIPRNQVSVLCRCV